MSIETIDNLNSDTLDRVKDLVRINRDSANGFADAAEVVDNEQLKSLFRAIAMQREGYAVELNRYVDLNDDDANEISGSWRGTFHRWWLDLRGKLSGGDAHAVLAEAERGEDAIKHMYEDVLKQTAGSPLNQLLHVQYAEVKKGHDTIRDLRDATAEAEED